MGLTVDDMFASGAAVRPSKERIEQIPIEMIAPHPRNARTVTPESLDEAFKASVAAHGVLQPIIVKNAESGRYILLAGHCRLCAAKLAGQQYVPCIVKRALLPGEEQIYLTNTNLQRELKTMLPSQKCRALIDQYDGLKEWRKYCQVNDENDGEVELGGKVFKFQHLAKTRQVLGVAYGLKESEVQQYLQLRNLSVQLFDFLDKGMFALKAAGYFAQLPVEWQMTIADCMDRTGRELRIENARQILDIIKEGKSIQDLRAYLALPYESRISKSKKRTHPYKVPAKVINRYFEDTEESEIEKIIEAALKMYFERCTLQAK